VFQQVRSDYWSRVWGFLDDDWLDNSFLGCDTVHVLSEGRAIYILDWHNFVCVIHNSLERPCQFTIINVVRMQKTIIWYRQIKYSHNFGYNYKRVQSAGLWIYCTVI
jgi:hypothetical protein